MKHIFTIDVEDWFNILDTAAAPGIESWKTLESRFGDALEKLLELLEKHQVRATMFWLGWFAEHHPELLLKCVRAGHEIASHGYGHVLAYKVGRKAFFEDIAKGKKVIEDQIGIPVRGFRAAGFSTTDDSRWVFDEIARAGYTFDSSIFPASRGHGGMRHSSLVPRRLETENGPLIEFPQSMLEVFGTRFSLFGGGYLRLAPWPLIHWGVRQLEADNRPLIVYVHPREIDPKHPRLKLSLYRYFKCYINLNSTLRKLDRLLATYEFSPMGEFSIE